VGIWPFPLFLSSFFFRLGVCMQGRKRREDKSTRKTRRMTRRERITTTIVLIQGQEGVCLLLDHNDDKIYFDKKSSAFFVF